MIFQRIRVGSSVHVKEHTRVSRKVVNMVAERGFPPPPQEQTPEKICEKIADVHVPQVVERIIEVPVPEMVEQLVRQPKTHSPGQDPAADCGAYHR